MTLIGALNEPEFYGLDTNTRHRILVRLNSGGNVVGILESVAYRGLNAEALQIRDGDNLFAIPTSAIAFITWSAPQPVPGDGDD